ncbi:MAG: hypothetical protein WKF41_18265 [Gaiellaceae bacterium]
MAEVAAERGLPVQEVERMLGAFWESAGQDSPVHVRAETVRRFWFEFGRLHSVQAPGMVPLWGLVEESGTAIDPGWSTPYQAHLHTRLLCPELLASITRCWGTTTLARWPDRVVSEPFPHVRMAETLGPALRFWNGCALTAWFVCEGPSSRTDLQGLEKYHTEQLVELDELDTPIDRTLFTDLLRVPLGPEQPLVDRGSSIATASGFTIHVESTHGSRRDGFEQLRDVITRHCRGWTQTYLERYLRARWERMLKATRRQFDKMTEDRGKPPTLKQFAKHAVPPAQLWFGGDVGLLYAALGLKQAFTVERRSLLPKDPHAFAEAVFRGLGGVRVDRSRPVSQPEDVERWRKEAERERKLMRLAADALPFVQALEALGREPTRKEAPGGFAWAGDAIATDAETAWETFASVVGSILQRGVP